MRTAALCLAVGIVAATCWGASAPKEPDVRISGAVQCKSEAAAAKLQGEVLQMIKDFDAQNKAVKGQEVLVFGVNAKTDVTITITLQGAPVDVAMEFVKAVVVRCAARGNPSITVTVM